jgi:signal transduction histidine kinase
MEAIGTLAGGIAHDFNNILCAILGYSELLVMDPTTPPPVRETLQEVIKASQRGSDMVRQILAFSRRQRHERRPLLLQLVVRESLRFLRASLPATIDIRSEIDPAAPAAHADPTQIQQVVMNLCTNAAHAMRDRPGQLTVNLREETVTDAEGVGAEVRPGRYTCLTVSDTGVGIPEAALGRIFEPFFTTKGIGEGTGLGLAVVHGIVKDHDGAITVTTREQVGTTFRVYLPAIDAYPRWWNRKPPTRSSADEGSTSC